MSTRGADRPARVGPPLAALALSLAGATGALVLALAVTPAPAWGADGLEVRVTATGPGTVHLEASVTGVSAAAAPPVSVSVNGSPVRAEVDLVRAAPADRPRRAVAVLLDASGSMTGAPWKAATEGVAQFVSAVPADVDLALVTAADPPALAVAPTPDRGAVSRSLAGLRPRGDTALYGALRTAAKALTGYAERRLLVFSDGQDSRAAREAPAVIAELAAARIPVDVVALGTSTPGLTAARALASGTGGTFYQAANPASLAEGFRAAAQAFDVHLAITVPVPPGLEGAAGALTVTVEVRGGQRGATLPVEFPGVRQPAATTVAAAPRPMLSAPGVAVLVFLAGLGVCALVALLAPRGGMRARLGQIERYRTQVPATQDPPGPQQGSLAHTLLGLSERAVRSRGQEPQITLRLERAGIRLRAAEWVALRTVSTLTGAVLVGLALGVPGSPLGGLVGWALPGLYRWLRRSRRSSAFASQLPDALQLIVGSLRAGFTLNQAVGAVASDTSGLLGAEFARAAAETRLGVDLADALERVADRTGNADLSWATMAIRIQRTTGGNLAEILDRTAETIRERGRLRGQVRALSAEGRMSAYVLAGMPVGVGLWMVLVRREYISLLWTTGIGVLLLGGAVVLLLVGLAWMSRCARVEV